MSLAEFKELGIAAGWIIAAFAASQFVAGRKTGRDLAERVTKLEDEWKALDQKVVNGFSELSDQIAQRNREGEDRATKIHTRIDPILENTGEIKGQMYAFTKSFESFTKMMVAMVEKGTK